MKKRIKTLVALGLAMAMAEEIMEKKNGFWSLETAGAGAVTVELASH